MISRQLHLGETVERKGIQRRLAAILAADVVGYSRLMGADEVGTLTMLKAHRRELIDPAIAGHSGRIVKTTGDGMLVEFGSVVDAVGCALAVQRAMSSRNAAVPEDRRIIFRVGINVGDIIIDGDDIFGDGVNIAARLQTLCEPGGLCISRTANDQIRDKLSLAFADLGEQTVKNISRAIGVFGLGAKQIEALPEAELLQAPMTAGVSNATQAAVKFEQEIQFCTSQDGVKIAFSRIGRGQPLVKTGNWMTHLEFDFESPIWRHLYRELSRDHTLIRYDARGNGLSDREVEEVSYEAFLRDLEAVVDAAGIERFALLGISQGCAVSIGYAVRHAERVTHLILLGGYPQGWRKRVRPEAEKEQDAAMLTLMRLGWGQENPAFRQLFTSQFIPGGTKEQADWFNELQRVSTSPADAVRNLEANGDIDVAALLSKVTVPTLVLHARDDARVPFDSGRRLAAGIPGARFVPLQSRNHLILENEPAFERFLQEIRTFLGSGSQIAHH
jgi:class 3 adenylate cyclase/pimeloyl-ACP methyl ester carboxylesterase